MNLKDMLSRVSYDDRHETTADVISLHSFDSAKCESEIKRLDVQAHEIRNQLRTERATYEETIATLENQLSAVEADLAEWRGKVRSWAGGLGALRVAGDDDK